MEDMQGESFHSVVAMGDTLTFTNERIRCIFYHSQDCCENVEIEDINGDLNDLINTPLVKVQKESNEDPSAEESGTWTFYHFRTIKGTVTIRWYGTSNGYYSEEVNFRAEKIQ